MSSSASLSSSNIVFLNKDQKLREVSPANNQEIMLSEQQNGMLGKTQEKIVSKMSLKEKTRNKIDKFYLKLKENYCSENLVVGLDITPNCIRVAVSEEIAGKWKIKNLYSKNISNNAAFENLEKNKNLYGLAIKDIFTENKIKNKNVAIALPTSLAIIKNITMPLMPEENLAKATKIPSFWQNLVQITENLKDYYIFYKVVKRNTDTNEMDLLFVALKSKDVKTFYDIIDAAGLKCLVVDVSCFSLNNLSKLKEESEDTEDTSTKAVIKIGVDENYLQVLDKGKPYIYDIFVPESEKLYLNEYIEHQTFQTRFIAQVKHILSKHKEKFGIHLDKIEIICSASEQGSFIEKMKESIEDVKVENLDLFKDISFSKDLHDKIDSQKTSANVNAKNDWAVAIGLSTRKLKLFNDRSDTAIADKVNLADNYLDNIAVLKARFISKITISLLAIGFGILLLSSSAFFYALYKIKVAEVKKFNELNQQYIQKTAEFKAVTSDSGQLMHLIKANENAGSNQEMIILALNDLSSMIPDGVWVEKIEFIKDGEFKISGNAYDEKNILKFSRTIDESEIIKESYINSIKTLTAENGAVSRVFDINAKLAKNPKPKEK